MYDSSVGLSNSRLESYHPTLEFGPETLEFRSETLESCREKLESGSETVRLISESLRSLIKTSESPFEYIETRQSTLFALREGLISIYGDLDEVINRFFLLISGLFLYQITLQSGEKSL